MLTLLKREIEDHKLYFMMAFLTSVIFSASIVGRFNQKEEEAFRIIVPFFQLVLLIITVFGVCGLGISQMNMDRNAKIAAFLSTLPVTRSRIFAARVLAGVIMLLILLVPPAVTLQMMIGILGRAFPVYRYFTAEIFSMLFLTGFGIYCTGLMSGFSREKKPAAALSSMFLSGVLLTLIVVKGFGPEASVIMFLYSAAGLLYCWRRFEKAALI